MRRLLSLLTLLLLIASTMTGGVASVSPVERAERAPTAQPSPDPPEETDPPRGEPRAATLLQLNLCLSGVARCYSPQGRPAKLDEAVATIRGTGADVVVINEACSVDVARVARRTGMALTFSAVSRRGTPFACRAPGGRGDFGNAVLSERPADVLDASYRAQAGVEERRALCAVLRGLTVCGTHLSNRTDDGRGRTVNARQCEELSAMLAGSAQQQPVIAAGDLNRRSSCAPPGFTTFTDADATQARGIQHAYVDPRLEPASSRTLAMETTDHDALVLSFRRPAPLGSGIAP